jgi:hypothetical protein
MAHHGALQRNTGEVRKHLASLTYMVPLLGVIILLMALLDEQIGLSKLAHPTEQV